MRDEHSRQTQDIWQRLYDGTRVVSAEKLDMVAPLPSMKFCYDLNDVGANATVLVPPLQRLFDGDLRAALLVLFPGCTILGTVFLIPAWLVQVRISRNETESRAKRDIPWRTDSFTL